MSNTVYIVFHTNSGTPERNTIHGVYTSQEAAEAAMVESLYDMYGISAEINAEEDYAYMWYGAYPLNEKYHPFGQ